MCQGPEVAFWEMSLGLPETIAATGKQPFHPAIRLGGLEPAF